MPERSPADRLDDVVEALLRRPEAARVPDEAALAALWRVAADLLLLPRAGFEEGLREELERRTSMTTMTSTTSSTAAVAVEKAYRAATPFLTVKDPAAALDFYRKAFGAVEKMRLLEPGGQIAHAEFDIGEARFMLGHEYPPMGLVSPETLGGSPVTLHLYVDDVDAVVARAAAAGATVLRPPSDEFYGDRSARLRDPFGFSWGFATRKEDVSLEEMQRRLDALMRGSEES